jgi:hypothetical protein
MVSFAASAQELPLVEGDRELFDVLRAAQQTNLTSYSRGRMKATIDRSLTASPQTDQAQVTLIWDGDQAYWEYDSKHSNSSGKSEWYGQKRVESPSLRLAYSPQRKNLVSSPKKRNSIPEYLLIRPKDCWYKYGEQRTWLEVLDPAFGTGFVTSVSIRKLDTDVVRLEREYLTGHRLRIDCSLKQGANVVRYESFPPAKPPEGDQIDQGTYSWVPDGMGGHRLELMEANKYAAADRTRLLSRFSLRIHEFDPHYVPPRDQFTMAALKVAPGTLVDEYNPQHRSYLYGIAPAKTVQGELDELLPKLKQSAKASTSPARDP